MEPTTPAPTVADGVDRPLDPRSITVSRIGGWIFFGVVSAASLIGVAANAFFSPMLYWLKAALLVAVWPLMTAGLAWLAHQWPVVEHRHSSYRVDEEGIEIRRGVLWRHVIDVPRNRVQHTDVSQGPLERGYGLGTLVMFTAGTEHAKVTLGGLDHAQALRIRDHLLATEHADAV
jgi:membrane protein YdbS with pleckstrin-like domain